MLKKLAHFIEDQELIDKSKTVLVGVSGGLDSVALLHILHNLGYTCIVAHCNFHLRAEESIRDEAFVENLAKTLQVKYLKIDFDTFTYAKEHKLSIEMAARELRYTWFEKMSKTYDAPAIAIAHHANDSVETVLLNLVRGTGLKGLTGISAKNGKIIRPLINCYREEIERYAKENNIQYIIDSTNLESDYARNKIRNQVLPILATINPAVIKNVFQSSKNLQAVWEYHERSIQKIEDDILSIEGDQIRIDIDRLRKTTDINLVLYEVLKKFNFNAATIYDIVYDIENKQSGLHFFSPTHHLIKDRESLIIQAVAQDKPRIYTIDLSESAILEPIHLSYQTFEKAKDFKFSTDPATVHLDRDKINQPLYIRKWQAGDFFFPLGMNSKKKLSDFFVDSKLNLFEKENQYLLCAGNDILWVIGKRLDNRYKLTKSSKNILEIKILK